MRKFITNKIGNLLLISKRIDYTVAIVENNPAKDKIPDNRLLVVGGKGYVKWLYMKCPCGCEDVLTLALNKKHHPNWILKIDRFNRPNIYPSIWKNDGCESHFWIRKGKLVWAK